MSEVDCFLDANVLVHGVASDDEVAAKRHRALEWIEQWGAFPCVSVRAVNPFSVRGARTQEGSPAYGR